MVDLSIVIVNYNVRHFLEQCLDSVYNASKNIRVEVFVIDNASVDGSQEYITTRFPQVDYTYNIKNLGFSKANNQGIRHAKGRYILLLNPDTLVEEDTFSKCVAYMDGHNNVGGLGVKMVDGSGLYLPESKRGLPTPWVAFYKIFGLSKLFPSNRRFGKYHLSYLSTDEINEVEVLSGAFMWLRKEAIDKVGLLDEDYFMYGEDIDLSYRLLKGGYKNVYFPETRIIHYKGESTKRTSVNYVLVFYRAMLIFSQKHFASQNNFWFNGLIESAVYLRALYAIVNRVAQNILLPLLDFAIIWLSMYVLKGVYEVYVKHDASFYPPSFTIKVIPIYALTWVLSCLANGAYNKPYRAGRIWFAMFTGALIISAVTNFFDAYRFSKALILMGTLSGAILLTLNRAIINYFIFGRLTLSGGTNYRTLIIGDRDEAVKTTHLIAGSNLSAEIIGWVSPPETISQINKLYIGKFENLTQIVDMFKVNQIIFCSKSVAAALIIETMSWFGASGIQFKISAQNADYIIGSNGPQTTGELYSLDLNQSLASKRWFRHKQLFDFSFSLLALLLSPMLIWFVDSKTGFFQNIRDILLGNRTWVGFSGSLGSQFKSNKPGVVSTTQTVFLPVGNPLTAKSDFATHYSPSKDISIIFRSYSQLGKRPLDS